MDGSKGLKILLLIFFLGSIFNFKRKQKLSFTSATFLPYDLSRLFCFMHAPENWTVGPGRVIYGRFNFWKGVFGFQEKHWSLISIGNILDLLHLDL